MGTLSATSILLAMVYSVAMTSSTSTSVHGKDSLYYGVLKTRDHSPCILIGESVPHTISLDHIVDRKAPTGIKSLTCCCDTSIIV